VEESKSGEYFLSGWPTPVVASRYIARKLADQYVRALLDKASPMFGSAQPTVHGLLFEAIALKLLGAHHMSCRLEIKQLTRYKKPKILPVDLKHDGLLVLGEKSADIVVFDHEGDALDAITADLSKLALGLPRSATFAGFDATLVWPDPPDLPVLLLLQVTASLQHPLSDGGLELLGVFANSKQFSKIIIVYIVPKGVYAGFKKQELKADKPSKAQAKLFAVAQYCMKILPNQPSRKRKRSSSPEEESDSD
jgi:hypothetical protein